MTVHRSTFLALCALLASSLLHSLHAESPLMRLSGIDPAVIVCEARDATEPPPQFDSASCRQTRYWDVDPQGRMIWMKGVIDVTAAMIDDPAPLGLYMAGKTSADIYLNGVLIGRNGRPGASPDSEAPGRMDAVFYLPRSSVRPGDNELVVLMSSQHGLLRLRNPLHGIAIGPYANPTREILSTYTLSLLTFGAFILGGLYFAVAAMRNTDRVNSILLAAVCLFAAGQLAAETARGIFSYTYLQHDLRLLAIVFFSFGFGICLSAHVILRFLPERLAVLLGATAIVTITAALFVSGFDGKSLVSMLIPTLVAIGVSAFSITRKRKKSRQYFAALALFMATIILTVGSFLDVVFFYTVAAMLGFLFVQQAIKLAQEQEEKRDLTARAARLENALRQAQEKKEPPQLTIRNAGKLERVAAERITHCSGAGDYVEIHLENGAMLLHSGALAELEDTLPATFLRVHRSHIVNTHFVDALLREPTGVGSLAMNTGVSVPVSRRIMPSVRRALG